MDSIDEYISYLSKNTKSDSLNSIEMNNALGYKESLKKGKEIITKMEEIRIKYYPNVSIKSFSEEDKKQYEQLEKQLNEIQKEQKNLESHIPYMYRQQEDIESMKIGMLNRTDNEIPEITQITLMDSDFLLDNFKKSMRIAQTAVNAELNALNSGDYERAMNCTNIYSVAYSNFSQHYWGNASSEQLTEYIENKLGEKHKEILQQKVKEYQTLSPEMSNEEIISQFSDFRNILRICHTSAGTEEKSKAKEILSKVVNDKIAQLDKELTELKEHIELPENEAKIDEIQSQIEELEIATKPEQTFEQPLSKHKKEQIEEQGIDISEIMGDIQQTDKLKGRISQYDYNRINDEIVKKSEYLEKKLAYLQKYRDIPGNEERIADIESQIETMQDSWVVASRGINLQEIIENNNAKIDENRARLPEVEKELSYTIKNEPEKKGLIQRLSFEVTKLMKNIDKLENENSSIQKGTNKKYIGEHHKGRIDNDEKVKTEQEEKVKFQQERIKQKEREILEQQERVKAEREEKLRKENEERAKRLEEEILKREQETKAKDEEQARIKAEQEAKPRAKEQVRMRAEQNAKERVKEQARIMAEQNAKERAKEQVRIRAKQEAKARVEEQVRIMAEQEAKARVEEQAKIKAEQEVKARVEEQARIKAEQEAKERAEEQARIKAEQEAKVEEQQQPEKIRPREKSIKDELGNELKETEQQKQETKIQSIDLWMNRFSGWYSVIDKVSQNVKAKFVKMKSDIIKAISEKIKERSNKHEFNKNQDQNER